MPLAFVRSLGTLTANNVGTTTSGSFAALPAVNNLITVRVTGWHATAYTATVPTDNQGNTYTQRAVQANPAGTERVYLYDCVVATSGGTFTITLNNVQTAGNYIAWTAVEHSGATATPFDVAATQQEAVGATTTTCTTVATAQADELVVAVIGTANGSANDGILDPPTTGYTSRSVFQDSNTTVGHESADKIVTATGTQSATWTCNAANGGICSAVATYKAAAAVAPLGGFVPSGSVDRRTIERQGTVSPYAARYRNPQKLRPDGDVTAQWVPVGAATIAGTLDEAVRDPADYSYASSNGLVAEVSVQDPAPNTTENVEWVVRYHVDEASSGAGVRLSLYEGATLRSTGPAIYAPGAYQWNVPPSDVANIVDRNALRVRLVSLQ